MEGRRSTLLWLGLVAVVVVGGVLWANRAAFGWQASSDVQAPVPAPLRNVSAVGRIEPRHGVARLSGPPRPAVVIKELKVEEGARVQAGEIVAVVQGIDLHRAEVDRLRAELENATREVDRKQQLRQANQISESEYEKAELRQEMARAGLARAEAELALSTVRAPIDGTILKVHARAGERVGEEGILELGDTTRMYAVAEVYETDIGRVEAGQKARISSPALGKVLTGRVEGIGLLVGKQDTLETDPVADTDARVVEVEILLDDSRSASRLTNLRVSIVIEAGGGS